VPLEPPDQQHWQAATGYAELGMFLEADTELDKIDPFNRAAPEILAIRLAIYIGSLCTSNLSNAAHVVAQFALGQSPPCLESLRGQLSAF
jgi:hypothetical protein